MLADLAQTLHGSIVAHYAAQIADALSALEDNRAARRAAREFGRITGYLETMISLLEHHLDGRKLAGVKRRLERLDASAPSS